MNPKLALLPLAVALLISYLVTPLIIKFAKKVGIVDDPKTHKHPKVIHTYPIPRGGGLALFIAVAATSFLFLPIDTHLLSIMLGASILAILGFLDDKYDLNPYVRLLVEFLAASIPIISGIGISFISNPLGGIVDLSQPQINLNILGEGRSILIIPDIFALFWIVFIMNMLNMGAKGVDGQLTGTVAIAAITIMILSLRFSADITQWPVIILAAITAGAYLGFLPWHIFPQKIMPSYGGAILAGYLLAILSILATTKVGTLMVVTAVPLIDTGYAIVRRIAAGKSPVWGDRGHLHHKLLDAGVSKSRIAVLYWVATALLGILAINLNTSFKFYTIIGVGLAVGGVILWLTYQSQSRKP